MDKAKSGVEASPSKRPPPINCPKPFLMELSIAPECNRTVGIDIDMEDNANIPEVGANEDHDHSRSDNDYSESSSEMDESLDLSM